MGLGNFLGDVHDASCGPNSRGCEAGPAEMCPYGTALATSRSSVMSICTGQSVTGRLRMRKAASKPSHMDKVWLL